MIDGRGALEAVIQHAEELESDYDDIEPTVEALADCGDISLVPALREALDRFLDEENVYGRDLIAGVLAGIDGPAALPALLRASARDLGDDQDALTAEIIDLLQEDPDAGRWAAVELAGGDTPELRLVGVWALGFVDDPEDVELLAAAVADPDPRVRAMAIGSIHDPAGDDRAFRALVQALRDEDEQVRVSAVNRLGGVGRQDAVAPLIALAGDPAPRVRSVVAYALGRLGDDAAGPVLRQLLRDTDQHVRERADEALGSLH